MKAQNLKSALLKMAMLLFIFCISPNSNAGTVAAIAHSCKISLKKLKEKFRFAFRNYFERKWRTLATYKVIKADGEVLNLRFLNEAERNAQNRDKPGEQFYIFENLETGQNVALSDAQIVSKIHIPFLKDKIARAKQKRENPDIEEEYYYANKLLEKSKLSVYLLDDSKSGIQIRIDKSDFSKLSKEEQSSLRDTALRLRDELTEFDELYTSFLGKNSSLNQPLLIQFVHGEKGLDAFTSPETVKVEGLDQWVIFMPYDTTRSSLGISVGTLLHERAHNITGETGVTADNRSFLFKDESFSEGLADFLPALHKGDPVVGRNHLDELTPIRNIEYRANLHARNPSRIKSPMDAESQGVFEEHNLSIFYSYPLWRIHVANGGKGKQKLTRDTIESLFTSMKSLEESFQTYQAHYWGDDFENLNMDTVSIQNLEFFYASMYREAFINPKALNKLSLEQAYNDAKKNFELDWNRIEYIAKVLDRDVQNKPPQ